MKKNFCILLLLYFNSLFVIAQTEESVLYTNHDLGYSLLIYKSTKIYKQNIGNSVIETFVFKNNKEFKFAITISKVKTKSEPESLLLADYKNSYLNSCGCEILSTSTVNFKNFQTIQFKIRRIEEGKKMLGFSENFIIKSNLYNILYLTVDNNFETYKREYYSIINGFKVDLH